jgi:hypothetical protein
MKLKSIAVVIVGMFLSIASFSQQTAKPNAQTNKKIKPPKMFTTIGVLKDSSVAPVDQVKALIGSPLMVKDAQNQPYTITYYRIIYTRRAYTEDEKTGKISPIKTQVSEEFTQTPLSRIWLKILKEELLPGEELHFLDIIVKDKSGNIFYAPQLRITTK